MHRTNTRRPIHLFTVESTLWKHPVHRHNHYELVFVEEGTGLHHINDISEPFKKGDILFIQPDDAHYYTIKTRAVFAYIKFLNFSKSNSSATNMNPEILKTQYDFRRIPYSNCVTNPDDTSHMFMLLKIMQHEYAKTPDWQHDNLPQLLQVMLTIIFRNVGENAVNTRSIHAQKVTDILSYLYNSIYQSTTTDLRQVGDTFNLSPNYINSLVKEQTGITVHRHLIKYKMEAARKLLLHSTKNINEIARFLGFTDASHFSNTFKKEHQMSPLEYRKIKK
ncbi:AraC family transcriptional regulator [Spirosoma sp. BT702]|uniref:AraC family transcriptional regulator n=1 Tax=Spirosoma profusum TaxID=2771354 RepID=A0A927AU06_9BACT|nr:AraC family transcriptional regulator [Spirosoma profusum]MBD2701802.1 AraC family transcriptional regulator [Spirosoma profusum]